MRKKGSDLYGITLEKIVEKILLDFFSSGNTEITIKDIVKTLQKQGDFNFYRRVNNAIKNLQIEGICCLETKNTGDHRLPIIIIKPCLET
jgi:hypothetical protein